jgi:AcrR family transcriptional regulator
MDRSLTVRTKGGADVSQASKDRPTTEVAGLLLDRIDLEGCRQPGSVGPQEGTRGRLLISAVEMFATRGYDACSMRALAQSVGLGAGAIYNHYSSKSDILVAAVDYVLSDFMCTVLDGLDGSAPAPHVLGTILRRHVTYRVTHRSIAKANDRLLDRDFMVRTMSRHDRTRLAGALREYTHIVRELVQAVAGDDPDVDPVLRMYAVLNLINESANWYRAGGRLSEEILVGQFQTLAERLLGLDPGTLE